jgi:D-alanyl-D-alanine carboxypeptidase/D-alanyl-D-alanine-endopeptidase (penicillin-binding protein 4)
MYRKLIFLISVHLTLILNGQEKALDLLLSDSSLSGASVSLCILDAGSGVPVYEYNPFKGMMPASTMKLITTSAALGLLGPEYVFTTKLGYSGNLNKRSGKLNGDIVITGGGDPALGSPYFKGHYGDFINKWISEIRKAGIREISGNIIVDDSRYDYEPVPSKWLWEDIGNYYGAGACGLSVFDNTYEIHLKTGGPGTVPQITGIVPGEVSVELTNQLRAEGDSDNGYVYAAPHSNQGWISGTVPVNQNDFVLRASIPDPPLLLARILRNRLDSAGIAVTGKPTTSRIENQTSMNTEIISRITSPSLDSILIILNHESVNLYAEHLAKELGRIFLNNGSTKSGADIILNYIEEVGIPVEGIFIEDGSGLSPFNAVNARVMASMLFYMKNKSAFFHEFFMSLPEAGKAGTLSGYFRDPVFESRMRAKSGSITRVRCYAGYLETISGKELSFCIMINNYSGPSRRIISGIEEILKETLLHK